MAKRQADTSYSLFCQMHAQSKPYSVALKTSSTIRLGLELPRHKWVFCCCFLDCFFFLFCAAVSVFSSSCSTVLCASSPGVCFPVARNEAKTQVLTLQAVLVHSSRTFLQLISFPLFCLFFLHPPTTPLRIFPSQDIFTFYS